MLAGVILALQVVVCLRVTLTPEFFADGLWEQTRTDIVQSLERHPSRELMELLVSHPAWLRHSLMLPQSLPWGAYIEAVREWCEIPSLAWALHDEIVTKILVSPQEIQDRLNAILETEDNLQAVFERSRKTCIRVSHGVIPPTYWTNLAYQLAHDRKTPAPVVDIAGTNAGMPRDVNRVAQEVFADTKRASSAPNTFPDTPRESDRKDDYFQHLPFAELSAYGAASPTATRNEAEASQRLFSSDSASETAEGTTLRLRSFGYQISDTFLSGKHLPYSRNHSQNGAGRLRTLSCDRELHQSARGSISCNYPREGHVKKRRASKPVVQAPAKTSDLLVAISNLWAQYDPDVYQFNSVDMRAFPDAMAHSVISRVKDDPSTCYSQHCARASQLIYRASVSTSGLTITEENPELFGHWMFVPLSVAANDSPMRAKEVFKKFEMSMLDVFDSDTPAGLRITQAGTVLLTLSSMAFELQTFGPSHADTVPQYPQAPPMSYHFVTLHSNISPLSLTQSPSPRHGLHDAEATSGELDIASYDLDNIYRDPLFMSPTPAINIRQIHLDPLQELQLEAEHRADRELLQTVTGGAQPWGEHLRHLQGLLRRRDAAENRAPFDFDAWEEWVEAVAPSPRIRLHHYASTDVMVRTEDDDNLSEYGRPVSPFSHYLSQRAVISGLRDRLDHSPQEQQSSTEQQSGAQPESEAQSFKFNYHCVHQSGNLLIKERIADMADKIAEILYKFVRRAKKRGYSKHDTLRYIKSFVKHKGISISDVDDRMFDTTEDPQDLCSDLEFMYIVAMTMVQSQQSAQFPDTDAPQKQSVNPEGSHGAAQKSFETAATSAGNKSGISHEQDSNTQSSQESTASNTQPGTNKPEEIDFADLKISTILKSSNVADLYQNPAVAVFSTSARISYAVSCALQEAYTPFELSLDRHDDELLPAKIQQHPDYDLAVRCHERYLKKSMSDMWACTAILRIAKEFLRSIDSHLSDQSESLRASWMLQSITAAIACAEHSLQDSSPAVEELAIMALEWPKLRFAQVAPALLSNFANILNGHHDRYISATHGRLRVHPATGTHGDSNLRVLDNTVRAILKFAPGALHSISKWRNLQPFNTTLSPLPSVDALWSGPCQVLEALDFMRMPALRTNLRQSFFPTLDQPLGVAIELPTGRPFGLEYHVVVCRTAAELVTAGVASLAAKLLQPTHGCVDSAGRAAPIFVQKDATRRMQLEAIDDWPPQPMGLDLGGGVILPPGRFCHAHWGCATTVGRPVRLPALSFCEKTLVARDTWAVRALETLTRLVEASVMLSRRVALPLDAAAWRAMEAQCLRLRESTTYYRQPVHAQLESAGDRLAELLCADMLHSISVDHLVASGVL